MEIIGVPHVEKYIGQVERYLKESYPEGIRSLLVELPPISQDVIDAIKSLSPEADVGYSGYSDGFFSIIANKYRAEGTKIIYGDINRQTLGMNPLNFSRALEDMFGTHRDEGIRRVFEQEQPEVTLLGTAHAGKLKKVFPEIPFTRFYDKDSSWRTPNYFVTQMIPSPDKTVCLE